MAQPTELNYPHAKRIARSHCGACAGARTRSPIRISRRTRWPSILSLALKHTNGLAITLRPALRSDFLFPPDVFLEMVRAGIFYGRAWREQRRVPASAITHASVDAIWSFWF